MPRQYGGDHQGSASIHFIECANIAIDDHGYFAVALSGGSTPKAIFHGLSSPAFRDQVDWSRVVLFWSDERCVPPDHSDSNYHMAMEAGFSTLPIPIENIFRMKGEDDPEESALKYEKIIADKLGGAPLDLVMLGMGSDGHTASLFPKTHGLHPAKDRLAIANYIPQLDTWRLTLTFRCINEADYIAIYVLGTQKAEMVKKVFNGTFDPDIYPVQNIGTARNHALWIMDDDAAALLSISK
ncbi:MAG: 6-phosphogluconolactonase [Chlamydiales bacterium]|nr:6-phosphogluconolactonase [Chlamydiales bacterium]